MGEFRRPERRVYERVSFSGTANVTTSGGALSCNIVDISRGGLALRSQSAAQPGEFVRMRLSVPKECGARTWLDPDAFVVRVQRGPNEVLWAVMFASTDPARDALITRLIESIREVPPEDRLRTGTIAERNRALKELLTKAKTPPSSKPQPARSVSQTSRKPEPARSASPSPRGPSNTPREPEPARSAPQTPRKPEPARNAPRKRRKRSEGGAPAQVSTASRELQELYKAALERVESDGQRKRKR